jgi:sigma-E factor negative regulatory protein RseB
MVLRRDVLDAAGAVVRTTAFDDLKVGPLLPVHQRASLAAAPGRVLDDGALGALEAQGWPVVHVLPAGLELFEARMLTEAATDAATDAEAAGVLQLSYSDGLSTLSLFVQDGELSSKPHGTARPVGGGTVWVSAGSPQRVVWSGEGRTWTLVSDAPESTVEDALLVLPHKSAPVGDSPLSRVWRGMAVVGSWLNPFE